MLRVFLPATGFWGSRSRVVGTNPNDSGDIANVVSGVLAKNLVTDFVGVAYRELSMEYLT